VSLKQAVCYGYSAADAPWHMAALLHDIAERNDTAAAQNQQVMGTQA
jgi:hypothetical protein